LFILAFTVFFGRTHARKIFKIFTIIIKAYLLVEVIIFIINIFNPIAIDYIYRENAGFAWYAYDMKVLYWMHLVYTYFLVVCIIITLIYKAHVIPSKYRMPFRIIIYALLGIVFINAGFLFIPKKDAWSFADYSILFYSIGTAICYWASFVFPRTGMLNYFKTYIFENVGQGIILFDYENEMLLSNEKALKFFNSSGVTSSTPLKEFLEKANISVNMEQEAYSLQCYCIEYGKQKPLRCDYRKLRDETNTIVGRLFVFADAQLDTDLLTGFHNWESFRKFAVENGKNFPNPTTTAVCDINRLSVFNTIHGRNKGDQLLKSLSDIMRRVFPEDTYYVRGQDAYLIAVCYNKTEEEVKRYMVQISNEFEEKIQYSLCQSQEDDENL
jgi:GGDEF domain-containing protein